MGINKYDAEVLLYAKKKFKVDFESTLTLGRLTRYFNEKEIQTLFSNFNFPLETPSQLFSSEYTEPLLELLGAVSPQSMDVSDYEKASIIHDLNTSLPSTLFQKYSAVIDGGTLEHVFNFPVAIQSCMNALHEGGFFIGCTPGNNQMGHGFYQFSPELYYRIFSEKNGFKTHKVLIRVADKWFEAMDPLVMKSRIEVANGLPIFIYVIAEKTKHISTFDMPQQSDYVTSWAIAESVKTDRKRNEDSGLKHNYRKLMPKRIKDLVRNFYDLFIDKRIDTHELGLINPRHFKQIDLAKDAIQLE